MVCALVLDERDLLRAGVLLLVLPVLTALLHTLLPLRLEVSRSVGPEPASVGQPCPVTTEVRAVARQPAGGLLVLDPVPAELGRDAVLALPRLRARESAVLQHALLPTRRGEHRVGPLRVSLTDALGLVQVQRPVGAATPVLVRPRVEPLRPVVLGGAAGAETAARASSGHAVRDTQLRGYVPGDEIRSIHWRSSARRDELMVRTAEQGQRARVTVLLDNRDSAFGGPAGEPAFERAVSLAASLAEHLRRTSTPVRVVTADAAVLAPGGSGLDQLAVLGLSATTELGPALAVAGSDELVAVLGEPGAADATVLLEHRARVGAAGTVAHLLPGDGVPLLTGAGWLVTAVGGSTPLADLLPAFSAAGSVGR